jgi:nucleoside-diphosphate-sugar epimerase
MSEVLIAGNKGFIGSRLQKSNPEWDGFDLKDGDDIKYARYEDYGFLILLAANLGQDKRAFDDNVQIASKLLKNHPKDMHVVYTSTAAVYEGHSYPHTEDESPYPETLYGKSKYLGEQIVRMACENYTILRLANVYGDGDGNGAVDIFDRGGNKIYGDGKQIRDYIHVDEVTGAISQIVATPDKYNNEVYNISTGRGHSVKEMFAKHGTGKPEFVQPRHYDVPYSVLDNTKALRTKLL